MRFLSLCLTLTATAAAFSPTPGNAAPRSSRPAPAAAAVVRKVELYPRAVLLEGVGARQQLLVTGRDAEGRDVDLTASAQMTSGSPRVAVVRAGGVVEAVGEGETVVAIRTAGSSSQMRVAVRGTRRETPLSFRRDILPVLSRAGCAQGACHAKQGGQNGFMLSVLAYDPESDYRGLVYGAGGRRV
ncbi:MAG: hypothetical protein FJX77_16760, partial [Armatimonadetes bacterium]|nr:hypothetical protein [Armatimonadota bacterium]